MRDPSQGKVEVDKERYVYLRASGLSYEFVSLLKESLGAKNEVNDSVDSKD